MKPIVPARNGMPDFMSTFRLANFEATWAGPNRRRDGFCFGSDDGRLLETDFNGSPLQPHASKVVPSGEAVNGVAFIKQWMAISTRNEVIVFTFRKQGQDPLFATCPFGAHGVIASSDGYFLAPLGREGLLYTQPKDGSAQDVVVSKRTDEELYFYRVISLKTTSGKSIVACATRKGGVAAMEFKGEEETQFVSVFSFEGLDVVDIAPLDISELAAPTVAVGRDGTVLLFRNVLTDSRALAVNYPAIKGTAYRILSARGNLFLLTSEGLYVIADLLTWFAEGRMGNLETPILPIPMEAVDANFGGDRWLLIVMPDGVLRLDLDLLGQYKSTDSKLNHFSRAQGTSLNPTWKERRVEQRNVPVLAGA